MNREEKKSFVERLKEVFTQYSLVVVLRGNGLDVSTVNEWRGKVRAIEGSKYMVIKNTLAKIALSDLGVEGGAEMFSGPTSIALSNDPVSIAKLMKELAKKYDGNLSIVGGLSDCKVVNADIINKFASMPSLEETRGQILAAIQSPLRGLYGALEGNGSSIILAIESRINEKN